MQRQITVRDLWNKKRRGEKAVLITAYDYSFAWWEDRAGVDIILVGDSLGMTVLGHPYTLSVSLEEMLNHTAAVSKAVSRAMVIGDMPFLTYQGSIREAVINAGRFLQVGASAVKIEGGKEMAETIAKVISAGIPVMGHIGLTPQSVHKYGGYRIRGKTEQEAREILEDACAVASAGVFAIIVESVVSELTQQIVEAVSVPVYGIGAGPHCDGQIIVCYDILGLYPDFTPSFAKVYFDMGKKIEEVVSEYAKEVREGIFPSKRYYTSKGDKK